jgi:hypothetical protein
MVHSVLKKKIHLTINNTRGVMLILCQGGFERTNSKTGQTVTLYHVLPRTVEENTKFAYVLSPLTYPRVNEGFSQEYPPSLLK